jgi:hypothetical protein
MSVLIRTTSRALVAALVVGILVGLGVGIAVSPLIYPPKVEIRKVIFYEGPGAWEDAPVTPEVYDQILLALSERFGCRLMEFGHPDLKRDKWLVLLHGLRAAPEDIGFIRREFPRNATLQIIGVTDACEVMVLYSGPPVIQVNC